MDYSFYLKEYSLNYDNLIKYGFKKSDNQLIYKKTLNRSSLYALIKISKDKIDVDVFDENFSDKYLPFYVKNNVCPEKVEVDNLIKEIAKTCFEKVDIKQEIVNFTNSKYGTIYETPWKDTPDYYTFKTNNSKKWYAIIMRVKRSQIKLDGDSLIDIMNVKLPKELILKTIDNVHYFPAYHMNKTYWITILLDKKTNLEEVKNFIDISYNLVEK